MRMLYCILAFCVSILFYFLGLRFGSVCLLSVSVWADILEGLGSDGMACAGGNAVTTLMTDDTK